MFVDEAKIEVKGGDGGNGQLSFRREKYVPRGGPDGGDGAPGGSVVAVVDPHVRTLLDFTYQPRYFAPDGGHGTQRRGRGKTGADLEVRLPVGTVVRAAENDEVVVDLTEPGQRAVLARGGRGGRGNAHFATSTRRAPHFAERGEPGQSRRLKLELKLLADVGLLGFPNVGKSSLIARVSAARPKIASYPFTTLVPNLGVVRVEEGRSFVLADLPGLIEGAHRGAGRGHDFLRHVERTRLLIHMLDVAAPERDPLADFATLNRELQLYDESLSKKPQLVALNKIDLQPPEDRLAEIEGALRRDGCTTVRISAATGRGVGELLQKTAQVLEELTSGEEVEPARVEVPTSESKAPLEVSRIDDSRFLVRGDQVERAVLMTDLGNEEAVRHLHRRLLRMGVIRQLRQLGARGGDQVQIGSIELEFTE